MRKYNGIESLYMEAPHLLVKYSIEAFDDFLRYGKVSDYHIGVIRALSVVYEVFNSFPAATDEKILEIIYEIGSTDYVKWEIIELKREIMERDGIYYNFNTGKYERTDTNNPAAN